MSTRVKTPAAAPSALATSTISCQHAGRGGSAADGISLRVNVRRQVRLARILFVRLAPAPLILVRGAGASRRQQGAVVPEGDHSSGAGATFGSPGGAAATPDYPAKGRILPPETNKQASKQAKPSKITNDQTNKEASNQASKNITRTRTPAAEPPPPTATTKATT